MNQLCLFCIYFIIFLHFIWDIYIFFYFFFLFFFYFFFYLAPDKLLVLLLLLWLLFICIILLTWLPYVICDLKCKISVVVVEGKGLFVVCSFLLNVAVVQCLSTRGQYSCETEALCLLLFSVCPLEASTAVRPRPCVCCCSCSNIKSNTHRVIKSSTYTW